MDIGRYDIAITPQTLAEQVKGAGFKNAVRNIPSELFKTSELQLEVQIRPTEMDYQIKESFWMEYQRARRMGRKMEIKNIFGPICTYTHFYNNILQRPPKLAWVLSPINGPLYGLPGFQDLIFERIFEILKTDICYKNGRPNCKIIDAQIKLFEILTEHMMPSSRYNGEGG